MEWQDLLNEFLVDLILGAKIFLPTIAAVYIPGRMLGYVKKDRGKNWIAFIVNYAVAYLSIKVELFPGDVYFFLWELIYRGSIGIVWYVLIGFRLFKRADHLLDKKVAKD